MDHLDHAGLDRADGSIFLNAVIGLAEPVVPRFLWRPQLSDAADEMVLEAAVNGRADALVTFNLKHSAQIPQHFGIEVLRPGSVLMRIR